MSKAAATATTYRTLGPEPWGRRLVRAREDIAGLTLAQAAQLAGHWMLTTDSTISRLESLREVPSGPRNNSRRQLACILCLAYQVNPEDFDLGPDDLPPSMQIPLRTPSEVGTSSTKWYAAVAA